MTSQIKRRNSNQTDALSPKPLSRKSSILATGLLHATKEDWLSESESEEEAETSNWFGNGVVHKARSPVFDSSVCESNGGLKLKRESEGWGDRRQCPLPECKSKFESVIKLRRHFIKHLQNNPFACVIPGCKKKLEAMCQLMRHLHWHMGKESKLCKNEKKVIFDDGELKDYQLTSKPLRNHLSSLDINEYLKTHLMALKAKGFLHKYFNEQNTNRDKYNLILIKHMDFNMRALVESDPVFIKVCKANPSFKHLMLLERRGRRTIKLRKHKCAECAKTFCNKSTMRHHFNTEHKPGPLKCIICGKRYRRRYCLNAHMSRHKSTVNVNYIMKMKSGRWQCTYRNCGFQSEFETSAMRHLSIMHRNDVKVENSMQELKLPSEVETKTTVVKIEFPDEIEADLPNAEIIPIGNSFMAKQSTRRQSGSITNIFGDTKSVLRGNYVHPNLNKPIVVYDCIVHISPTEKCIADRKITTKAVLPPKIHKNMEVVLPSFIPSQSLTNVSHDHTYAAKTPVNRNMSDHVDKGVRVNALSSTKSTKLSNRLYTIQTNRPAKTFIEKLDSSTRTVYRNAQGKASKAAASKSYVMSPQSIKLPVKTSGTQENSIKSPEVYASRDINISESVIPCKKEKEGLGENVRTLKTYNPSKKMSSALDGSHAANNIFLLSTAETRSTKSNFNTEKVATTSPSVQSSTNGATRNDDDVVTKVIGKGKHLQWQSNFKVKRERILHEQSTEVSRSPSGLYVPGFSVKLVCNLCPQQFSTVTRIRRHIREKHRNFMKEVTERLNQLAVCNTSIESVPYLLRKDDDEATVFNESNRLTVPQETSDAETIEFQVHPNNISTEEIYVDIEQMEKELVSLASQSRKTGEDKLQNFKEEIIGKFICRLCPLIFQTNEDIAKHIRTSHTEIIVAAPLPTPIVKEGEYTNGNGAPREMPRPSCIVRNIFARPEKTSSQHDMNCTTVLSNQSSASLLNVDYRESMHTRTGTKRLEENNMRGIIRNHIFSKVPTRADLPVLHRKKVILAQYQDKEMNSGEDGSEEMDVM